MKLQVVIELKRVCAGITMTQVESTEFKMLYNQTDGTIENYWRDDKFGISAWSGREKSILAEYEAMGEKIIAISDVTVYHFSKRSIESGVMIPP